jgi:predicted branched-subunit amino acid permease
MALAMTMLVYAGSAQLTALPLIAAGAPLWLIFAAGSAVNLRFLIFGAALQPYFRKLSWLKRLGMGYFTTDMSFVLFMTQYGEAAERGTRAQHWFYLGAIAPSWFAWQMASILGIYLGTMVPSAWSLDFAAVLALLAITVPLANSKSMLVSMLAAGLIAWVGQLLPMRLGLPVAVLLGVAVGMWAERVFKGRV